MNKPIVFFGTEDFSVPTLELLIADGYTVAAVVTKPDSKRGRGQQMTQPAVKVIAEQHGIPVLQPQKLSEITDFVQSLGAPVGILVSYGKIIPQSIIDLFVPGIINIHPSLLPLYRGPSPVETAVLHGDRQTGVSIMQLSAAMDAGPVYVQESIQLEGTETISALYSTLSTKGNELLARILPAIVDGTLHPTPQHNDAATYCQLIKKSDGVIDWHTSAAHIERQIRAYHDWPGSRTTLGSVDVIVTKAHVVTIDPKPAGTIERTGDNLVVHTSSNGLAIDALKPVGKKEMPVQAFLSGYASHITA
jgi:methionyl-tRNA formyltransferase